MNNQDLIRLRSRIVATLGDLDATAAKTKAVIQDSVNAIPNSIQDDLDAARGEWDLKNAQRIYNHTVAQQDQLFRALTRMKQGTYDRFRHCEEDIDLKRLEAMPGVVFCMRCQSRSERGGFLSLEAA